MRFAWPNDLAGRKKLLARQHIHPRRERLAPALPTRSSKSRLRELAEDTGRRGAWFWLTVCLGLILAAVVLGMVLR